MRCLDHKLEAERKSAREYHYRRGYKPRPSVCQRCLSAKPRSKYAIYCADCCAARQREYRRGEMLRRQTYEKMPAEAIVRYVQRELARLLDAPTAQLDVQRAKALGAVLIQVSTRRYSRATSAAGRVLREMAAA